MSSASSFTSSGILAAVVLPTEPTFSKEFAERVLEVRLTDEATERIRELLQRNNAGTLSPDEKEQLDNFMVLGRFVDLLQAKARLSLHELSKSE